MKGIVSLLIFMFSVTGVLMFVVRLLPPLIQVYQGDIANGTEAIVNATADEIVSSAVQSAVIGVLIAVFSALGLTWLVAQLKKL